MEGRPSLHPQPLAHTHHLGRWSFLRHGPVAGRRVVLVQSRRRSHIEVHFVEVLVSNEQH